MKKFFAKKNDLLFVIEEDTVGWYLIVYKSSDQNTSSEDYLLDTLEDAVLEANERYGISTSAWEPAE